MSLKKKTPTRKPNTAKKTSPAKAFTPGQKTQRPESASPRGRSFTGSKKTRSTNSDEEWFETPSRTSGRPPANKRKSSPDKPFDKKGPRPDTAAPRTRGFSETRKPKPEQSEGETSRKPAAPSDRPPNRKNKPAHAKPFDKKGPRPDTAPSRSRGFTGARKSQSDQFEEETSRAPARTNDGAPGNKRKSPHDKPFAKKTRGAPAASPRGRALPSSGKPHSEEDEEETFWSPAAPSDRSFASFLKPLIPAMVAPEAQTILHSSPLAHLDYSVELQVKDQGLLAFWKQHRLPGHPEQVIRSPRARGYRTTSKRKAFLHGSTLYLLLGDKAALPKSRQYFAASPLEPKEHEIIYRFLQHKLSEPAFRLIAGHLNYLIIRGSYTEQAVIFNVDLMNGPLVRKMKLLSAHLQKLPVPISAAFVYLDPSQSDYYLETKRPAETLHFKKLFGPDQLAATYCGCRYQFHPTSFSQINESMVETMLIRAKELLAPATDQSLLDLYCGYGLFSHFLAPAYRQVLAVDGEGPSIRAAEANSRLNKNRGGQTKFLAHRITAGFLEKLLPPPLAGETMLLDPPRQGTLPGVIASLARRKAQKVLHIFCGVDQIPSSLREWQANGYQVRRIAPLDMFPGSANLEILILMEPKK